MGGGWQCSSLRGASPGFFTPLLLTAATSVEHLDILPAKWILGNSLLHAGSQMAQAFKIPPTDSSHES